MKRLWLILAILFQLAALTWIAAQREWVVQTGETVYIRTAPIDPRDIFRGDFVRLDYETSTFSKAQVRDGLLTGEVDRGDSVYVPVVPDQRGLIQPLYATDIRPDNGLFLRGTVINRFYGNNHHWDTLEVKYGIEQYFVEQGKGLEIEEQRGTRTELQVPLEMELALGQNGTAIITGHRWSPLGIGLTVKRQIERDAPPEARSAILELTLKNTIDRPLSLVMLPNLCSFNLVSVKTAPQDLSPKRPECENMALRPDMWVTFAPDEERVYTFDLNQPPWLIEQNDEPVSIGTLGWKQRFRLVYRTPENMPSPPASDNTLIWTSDLPSRAFHGRGRID